MHYILFVRIARFYLPLQESEKPALVIRERKVLDCNESAQVRGVRVGMPQNQAKAILPQYESKAWKAEDYDERRREYLDACLPYSECIEPADQHEAFVDLSAHPRPADLARRLVADLARVTGRKVEAGAAPSKWMARLAADWDEMDVAFDDPAWFLDPMPIECLLPAEPEHRRRLRFLGYRTIGKAAALPLATLIEQFGDAGTLIYRAARGEWIERVRPSYPESAMFERLRFEGPVESIEEIERGFRALAKRLGERLNHEEKQASVLWVHLEEEDRPQRLLRRELHKPVRTEAGVTAALRQALRGEVREPLVSIGLTLPRLEPAKSLQRDLTLRTPPGEREGRAKDTLRALQAIFGQDTVKLGSDVVPERRSRVLREWKHATGWR